MKRGLSAATVVMLLAAALAIGPAPSATAETNTDKSQLQVWTVNIRKMHHIGPNVWRKFVRRVANHDVRPDLIAVTEMCNQDVGGSAWNDAFEFMMYLEGQTGIDYANEHAGAPGTACDVANSMVIWREDRFELGKKPQMKKWSSFTENPKDDDVFCSKNDGNNLQQVAVALWDKKQKKNLVFSSVHVPVRDSFSCINENVSFMDNVFEDLRPKRPLTIVGGDFNAMAQRESTSPGDELAAGTQVDPSCWYRSLNLLTVDDLTNCVTSPKHAPDRYSSSTDHYLDTVHVRHLGPTPGTTDPSICDEWTHNRKFATKGTACTDVHGKDGVPDGLTDRGRIDYIFARWEQSNGDALPIDSTNAPSLVTDAAADKMAPPRYADHRAVRALIEWCLPIDPC
ncbi:MAG TPA: hypothetical protein VEV82_10450 [Actinomycetota bacterium]|nr:hypothetical protein [Actinomycetota bacterium]